MFNMLFDESLLILSLLLIKAVEVETSASFTINMYKTKNDILEDRHCIDHAISHKPNQQFLIHDLYTFCIRYDDTNIDDNPEMSFIDGSSFSFRDLRRSHITPEQLLSWSASLDIVEDYQLYLLNSSHLVSNFDNLRFNNCTQLSFGPTCQFKFITGYKSINELFFRKYIRQLDDENRDLMNKSLTCYTQLECTYIYPYPLCLDWREICDGIIHCLNDAIDEQNCFELEMNECTNNDEYRCHNGAHCIPRMFWNDDSLRPDCIDRSDESFHEESCYQLPIISCEEYRCRPDSSSFVCGDGTCAQQEDCLNRRHMQRTDIFEDYSKSSQISRECWKTLLSLVYINTFYIPSKQCRNIDLCEESWTKDCPILFNFPLYPVALGHIRFYYENTILYFSQKGETVFPSYICYNESLCPIFQTGNISIRSIKISFDNRTILYCHRQIDLPISRETRRDIWYEFVTIVEKFYSAHCLKYSQIQSKNITENCKSHSQLYQCVNSTKCISKHRILDNIQDCPFGDDEKYDQSCSLSDHTFRFQCTENRIVKCISPLTSVLENYNCSSKSNKTYPISFSISFQTLCDGFEDIEPIVINGELETDETHCNDSYWPCNNTYTYCDGFWNCPDGLDEAGCEFIIDDTAGSTDKKKSCNTSEYVCISPSSFKIICLNRSRVNDGIIDCLGGSDERFRCRLYHEQPNHRFSCSYYFSPCIDVRVVCDGLPDCGHEDTDEKICQYLQDRNIFEDYKRFRETNICSEEMTKKRPFILDHLCKLDETNKPKILTISLKHFLLSTEIIRENQTTVLTTTTTSTLIKSSNNEFQSLSTGTDDFYRCNHGIPIQVRQKSIKKYNNLCLCPPAYYGLDCEYQNQRVTITIRFQTEIEWRTLFFIGILLIDSEHIVHSYQQLNYLPLRDCNSKITIYLLYKTRAKNLTKQYFVRIDAFVANNFEYRASWLYPIEFLFLPVHHLAVLITIPSISIEKSRSSLCHKHGLLTRYINTNQIFCYCDSGWRGSNCNISYTCNCSSDSICLGSPTSCLCPIQKYGHRCYLKYPVCSSNNETCLNGGLCVPNQIWFIQSNQTFLCSCPYGYSGDRCQYKDSRIELTFNKDFSVLPSLVFAHFISRLNESHTKQFTMISKLLFDQTSFIFQIHIDYHMIFMEFDNKYYFTYLHPIYRVSQLIRIEIASQQRCLHIHELFNSKTILNYHPLRRAKFYQKPCQERLDLKCFYDSDMFMCLCDLNRRTNCFDFDFQTTHNCHGNNLCKNQGDCFVDSETCPTMSMCICKDCFYGSQCQFTTKGFNPSLDVILGYHIRSHTNLSHQPRVVQISFALILFFFLIGFVSVSVSLSILTFKQTSINDTGCRIYLLNTSIISLILIFTFLCKFFLLYYIQYGSIGYSWLTISNCILTDYLLRILLNIGDWLNACVAIERLRMIKFGIKFDKKRSQQIAKWISILVILVTILTCIHDPIHRQLFYEKDENRYWCIADYESNSFIQSYDIFMIFTHFICPFIIQFISSIILIIQRAYSRSKAKHERFRKHFNKQFNEFYHLILTAWLLILLALPRLIIYFYAGCMKSAQQPWLALTGYFISFMPPILIFPIFILPSKTYRNICREQLRKLYSK